MSEIELIRNKVLCNKQACLLHKIVSLAIILCSGLILALVYYTISFPMLIFLVTQLSSIILSIVWYFNKTKKQRKFIASNKKIFKYNKTFQDYNNDISKSIKLSNDIEGIDITLKTISQEISNRKIIIKQLENITANKLHNKERASCLIHKINNNRGDYY